jgi:Ca-activated chloride channel family protein
MRLSKPHLLCGGALIALTGFVFAQQQGPITNNGSTGSTVSKPKKSADDTSPDDSNLPKIPSQYSKKDKPESGNLANFKSDVDLVTLDVAVLNSKNQFIPGIPPNSFRILEDNAPQQIKKVDMGEAPMTIAMVIEFSQAFQALYGAGWYQTLNLAWGFASTLKPVDYVAVIAYDMHTEILSDFTTDRMKTQEALHRLTIPAWREANLFDAVTDTADRMSAIEGRKAILLIASGRDTFSKLTFDKTRKSLQESGVPVYFIGILQMQREMADARGAMGPIQRMDYLQADNEMKTFAKETGGMAFFPTFMGEYGGIFQQVQQSLRNQYVISYSPTNKAHDGTYRKIKVELVNPATNQPVLLTDEKGKPIKYSIVAKSGYKAPRAVE